MRNLLLLALATLSIASCRTNMEQGQNPAQETKVKSEDLTAVPQSRSFGTPDPVHVLKSNETVWFLGQIYFNDPLKYEQILKDNGIESLQKVQPNQELKIIEPLHHPDDADFQARYTDLFQKRAVKLAERKVLRLQDQAKKSSPETRLPASQGK